IENAADPFFWQIFQRRLTPAGPCQRNIRAERFGNNRRINADLGDIPIRLRSSEKCVLTAVDEYVEYGLFKRRISGMDVRFPVAVERIDFNTATNRLTSI